MRRFFVPYKDPELRNASAARRAEIRAERRAGLGRACPPLGYQPISVTTDAAGAVRAVRSIPEGTGEAAHQPGGVSREMPPMRV